MSLPPQKKAYQVETRKVQLARSSDNKGSFHCPICDASFTAYDAYLDHCHSRLHMKNAGVAPPERVDDVERVRARLAVLREKYIKGQMATKMSGEEIEGRVEERILQRRLQEEQSRRERDATKKNNEQAGGSQEQQLDDEEATMMSSILGFKSFQ